MTSQWHNRRMQTTLQRYHNGELAGATARRLETHLSHCASCRAALQAWQEAEQALRQSSCRHAPALQNPSAMLAAVLAQTQAQTRRRRQVRQRQSVAVFTTAVAACGCWLLLTANHGRREGAGHFNNDFAASSLQQERTRGSITRQKSGAKHEANGAFRSVSADVMPRAHNQRNVDRLRTPRRKFTAERIALINVRHPSRKHNKTTRQMRIAAAVSRHRKFRLSSASSASLIAEALRKAGAAERVADVMAQHEFIALRMEAQTFVQDIHAPSSGAHLLVAVNAGPDKNRISNGLMPVASLPEIQASHDTSSLAAATFSQNDLAGTQVWNYCDIEQNGRSATTLRYAAMRHYGQTPAAILTVTTETIPPKITRLESPQQEPVPGETLQGEKK